MSTEVCEHEHDSYCMALNDEKLVSTIERVLHEYITQANQLGAVNL